jgi:hypothetical protein
MPNNVAEEMTSMSYRKNLAGNAGVEFADRPTWTVVRDAAAKKAGCFK